MFLYLARWRRRDNEGPGYVFEPNIPEGYAWAALDLRGTDEAMGNEAHLGARPWAFVATEQRITERAPGRILLGDSERDRTRAARRIIETRLGWVIPDEGRDLGEIIFDFMLVEANDYDGARPNRLRPSHRIRGGERRIGVRLLGQELASMPDYTSLSAAYTDDFNRTNSTGLGADWTKTNTNAGTFDVVSNEATTSQTNVLYYAYDANQANSDSQYCEVELRTTSGATQIGPQVRMLDSLANSSGYMAWFRGTNQVQKIRYTDTTVASPNRTDIASTAGNESYSVGDIGRIEVDGSDLEAFLGGSSMLTTTSTQYPASATRRTGGLYMYHVDATVDDWAFGDLASAPDAPTGLSGTPGSGQVSLTWTAPSDNGSAITDYIVQYRVNTPQGSWNTFADGTSTSTSATVTGLTNGTAYDFQVAAVNAIGTGPYSASDTETPATVPGAPTQNDPTVDSGTQITVDWTAPGSNGGSAITNYDIRYREGNPEGAWTTVDQVGTSGSYQVGGLDPATEYDFEVRATNAVGDSAWSNQKTATTQTVASGNFAVLLIGGNATISTDDTTLKNIIEGYTQDTWTVTYRDIADAIPSLTSYDLLVVSESIGGNDAKADDYHEQDIPTFSFEGRAWDASATEAIVTANPTNDHAYALEVVTGAGAHPIMRELGWTTDAAEYTLATGATGRANTVAQFGSGVDLLLCMQSDTNLVHAWAIEENADTAGTGNATNRRAGWGITDGSYTDMNQNGEDFLEASLRWLVGWSQGNGTVEIEDDFNRADGSLGSDWTTQGSTWDIVSNEARADDNNITATFTGATLSDTDEQWAEVKIVGDTGHTNWREWGVGVRMLDAASGDKSGYTVFVGSDSSTASNLGKLEINRLASAGTRTTVGTGLTGLNLEGKTVAIHVRDSTIKVYVDEVLQITATDTNIAASTTRESAGLWGYATADEVIFDDFRAGTGPYPPAIATTPNAGTLEISNFVGLTVAGETQRNAGTLGVDNFVGLTVSATAQRPWEKNAGTLEVSNFVGLTAQGSTERNAGSLGVSDFVGLTVGHSTQRNAETLRVRVSEGSVFALEAAGFADWIILVPDPAILIGSKPSDQFRSALATGAELQTVIELVNENDEILASTDEKRADEIIVEWGASGGDLVYDRRQRIQREFRLTLSVKEDQVTYFVPRSTASVLHPRSKHKVRVWGGYVLPNADRELFLMGTFAISSATAVSTSGMVQMELLCREVLDPLSSNFENAYQIAEGTNVVTAVIDILKQVLDLATDGQDGRVGLTAATTGYTTPAIDVEPGDNRRELVDQLLDAIGYEIRSDERGLIFIEPIAETSVAPESQPKWEYGDNGIPARNVESVWTAVDAPSGVTVVGGSRTEDTDPIEAQVWDSDPTSATYKVPSESGTSYRVDRVENEFVRTVQQGIISGFGYLRRNGRGGAEVVFEANPNPALRSGDTVRFCNKDLGVDEQLWRVARATTPLTPGGYMTVELHGSWDPSLGSELDSSIPEPNPPAAASISDDFNRPDENTEDDPNWTEHQWSWGLESNVQVQRYPGWSLMRWLTPFESTDHFAECTVTDINFSTNEVGPFVRSSGQFQGYGAMAHNNENLVIKKFTNNAPVADLGSWSESGGFSGKTIRLEAEGNELRAYVNGTLRITVTDSSYPSGTFVGIAGYGAGGTGSANSVKVDDFAGGEV